MKRVLFLLTFICMGIGMATAQTAAITGKVYSESDGEPVFGASVFVVGTSMGAGTDMDGNFTIENVPATATTIRVSYVGMTTQEVQITRGKPMKIVLVEDGVTLDDVVVVAYGTAKKSAFTGSASVVKAENIEKRQVSNVTNALSGAIAGVQITSANGQPGVSATVRVRGVGSLNAGNDPLYVVDGMPFDGDISSINPADIENMSVLKDAAASALYGARGANGVIMVTTKKGSNNSARISFDAKWGVNQRQIGKYDVMESPNLYMETLYKSFYNEGYYSLGYLPDAAHNYANSMLFPALGYQMYDLSGNEICGGCGAVTPGTPLNGLIGLDGKVDPRARLGYSDGKYYYTPDDWTKGMIESQLRQEYNFSVAGGTDKLNYYFSAGYLEDGGIIKNSGFNRLSTRLNVDYQAKKWLKVGTSLSYTNSDSRYPGEQTTTNSSGNVFGLTNNIAPVYPLYVRNADGSIATDASSGLPVYDYGDGLSTNFARNFMSMSNPMSDLLYNDEEYLADIFNGKWFAEITPIQGLKLTAALSAYVQNERGHVIGNARYGQSASYGGTASQSQTRFFSFNQQYLANYTKTFANNTIDLTLGYEAYNFNQESVQANGQNLYKPGDFTINNTIDQRRGYGSYTEYATRGFFGRLNWDYSEKYFVSASYRRDASSRFHPDKRWGNFWSASAAWVISKENFMKKASSWIDILKIKASFGQQGNDEIRNYYAYLDQYSVTGADGVFSDGLLVYKGNPELTWEKSNSYNAGIDFSLFKGKLSGTIEYFGRQTSDMLDYRAVAPSNGYSSIPVNVGSMTNSGVEIELNATPIEMRNFKWDIFANATYQQNVINELAPEYNGEYISGTTIYREGESRWQYYLPRYAGVDSHTGLALYHTKTPADEYLKKTMSAADYEKLTAEGNEAAYNAAVEAYNKNPERFITSDYSHAQKNGCEATGDLAPDVYGGFGTSFELYGFDFSIQFAYQFGGKIYDNSYAALMHGGTSADVGQNWHNDIAKAWTPENRFTDVPRLNHSDKYANSQSDRWLVSSDYLSLNNITFGYTFPKKWVRVLGLNSVRIYGAADNVALFCAREGMDPRKGTTSTHASTYSALRTISGGIKVTF
ncbi:MAG: TonB-dependent receptor [Bacteroidaceae bacterium]|nr:TonB-dependent receptor [Bacteroidaceae bacterium]